MHKHDMLQLSFDKAKEKYVHNFQFFNFVFLPLALTMLQNSFNHYLIRFQTVCPEIEENNND